MLSATPDVRPEIPTKASVNLAELLTAIEAWIKLYVVLGSEAQAIAIALWIAMTYVFDQFDTVPYLSITSPEKRSGKSRLLDLVEFVVARPWYIETPSEAVVYRKIDRDRPTILLDEVDAIYGPKAREHEGLRALLNAGHRRGAKVPRCHGPQHQLVEFEVFCPKALAGIGRLPDTVADRSIPIRLARRKKSEKVRRFRRREVEPEAIPLREQLDAWAAKVALREARPDVPDALNDRAADGWESMLAIADVAGGEWAKRAREAALALHGGEDEDEATIGVQLLADIRRVFIEVGMPDSIFSSELVEDLRQMEAAPWGDLDGKPLDARRLANLIKPFRVGRPKTVRIGPRTAKGYERAAFVDAWERYTADPSVTTSQPNEIANLNRSGSDTSTPAVTDGAVAKSADSLPCDAVTVEIGVGAALDLDGGEL